MMARTKLEKTKTSRKKTVCKFPQDLDGKWEQTVIAKPNFLRLRFVVSLCYVLRYDKDQTISGICSWTEDTRNCAHV